VNDDDAHREYLLAALRAASLRVKLMDADLTTVGVALKGDLIHPDMAMKWLKDLDLLFLLPTTVPLPVGQIERTME
jgi:hypothetical protein